MHDVNVVQQIHSMQQPSLVFVFGGPSASALSPCFSRNGLVGLRDGMTVGGT